MSVISKIKSVDSLDIQELDEEVAADNFISVGGFSNDRNTYSENRDCFTLTTQVREGDDQEGIDQGISY